MIATITEDKLSASCPICRQLTEFSVSDIEEAATLVCPICGARFSLTATLMEPVSKQEPSLPGLPSPGGIGGPSSITPPSNFSAPSLPPAPESNIGVFKYIDEIDSGVDVNEVLDRFLDEVDKESAGSWRGMLSAFSNKIQSLIDDVGYDGDAGDLISDLQDGKALELTSDGVSVDLSKMKKVLMSDSKTEDLDLGPSMLSKPVSMLGGMPKPVSMLGNVPSDISSPSPTGIPNGVPGSIGASVDLQPSEDDKEDKIDKAIETYFS